MSELASSRQQGAEWDRPEAVSFAVLLIITRE